VRALSSVYNTLPNFSNWIWHYIVDSGNDIGPDGQYITIGATQIVSGGPTFVGKVNYKEDFPGLGGDNVVGFEFLISLPVEETAEAYALLAEGSAGFYISYDC
jgi:hypothetical protein